MLVISTLMAIGCGATDGSTVVINNSPTSDFFHLAIVPEQTVSTATFEVQVIAENIDPTSLPFAPIVIDGSGISHVMALKTLKWPGTAVDSVTIYSATIPLAANQVNNIKAVSGTKELPFSIRHKSALNVLHAANSAELQAYLKTATCSNVGCTPDTTIDVIEVDYVESDLGAVINGIGTNTALAPTQRTSWLTVKPGTGSLAWKRDSSSPLGPRPKIDFLHLDNVVFGSNTSDGGAGQLFVELNHRIWVSGSQFWAKYDTTWSKDTLDSAGNSSDIRVLTTEGQKVYYTDCSWHGTASDYATFNAELARDLTFDSHRGDFNRFGKVFLNALADNVARILVPCTGGASCPNPTGVLDTDYIHNDGFQIYGVVSNVVFKGFWVKSTTVAAEFQPFLFDRTFSPSYSNILVDGITIDVGAVTDLRAQFAAPMTNSRISNISFPLQSIALRADFGAAAFSPTNVRIHNANIKTVEYINPSGSITYTSASVANPLNAAPELNAIPGLSGAIFSNIKLN